MSTLRWDKKTTLVYGFVRESEKLLDLFMNIDEGITKLLIQLFPVLRFKIGAFDEKQFETENDRMTIKGSGSCNGYMVYADLENNKDMGDDSSIVQSARVSYGKGTKKVSTDEGLIKYLMRHWHSTPFEMCEIKYHVKLPIFIARQWIRHRTANVNEYSARYSILDKEFYLPSQENLATGSSR